MRISPSEEYGLRCILKLAQCYPDKLLTVDEIAQQEGLSSAYVEKLLLQLKKAGLVTSTRGATGGYAMAKDPALIPVGRVMRALDGTILNDLCERFPGEHEECVHLRGCNIRPVWVVLAHHFYKILNQISLKDLMQEGEKALRGELYQRFPIDGEVHPKEVIVTIE